MTVARTNPIANRGLRMLIAAPFQNEGADDVPHRGSVSISGTSYDYRRMPQAACYHVARTHLALEKDAPTPRRVQVPTEA